MASLTVSFPKTSFLSISDAFSFADNLSNFDKTGILWNNRKGFIDYNSKKIIEALEKNNRLNFNLIERYSQALDNGEEVIFRYDSSKDIQVFVFVLEDTSYSLEDILSESNKRNFSFAYLSDSGKTGMQNTLFTSNYKALGKAYNHLPLIWDPILSPVMNEKIIDISVNPGHSKETQEIALMAAPEMWFGPYSWKFFDKHRILNYKAAIEVKEIIRDVVYVKLFDVDEENYETPKILGFQAHFRKESGMDEVEKKQEAIVMENYLKDNPKPIQTIETQIRNHPKN